MERNNLFRWIGPAMGCSFLAPRSGSAACQYVDPQVSRADYVKWCYCIGGTPYDTGNVGCTPPVAGGGTVSIGDVGGAMVGSNWQETVTLNMAQMTGGLLGQSIQNLFWGNPARQQAEIEQARIAARLEQERLAAQAQEREKKHQILLGLLKGMESDEPFELKMDEPPEMSLKGDTPFFGAPGNPPPEEIDLELKGFDDPGGAPSQNPMVQLNRAAFLSRKAAEAVSPEDAKLLSESAFRATTGGRIDFKVPDKVEGVSVSPEDAAAFTAQQKDYLTARQKADEAQMRLAEAEFKKELAGRVRAEAERKWKDAQNQPPPLNAAAERDKLAEAKKLLEEAAELDRQVTQELQKAREAAQRAQRRFTRQEESAHAYVKGLAHAKK